ncbi:MAG: response regulator [Cyanobacteria bacterium P01_G01_bin.54]
MVDAAILCVDDEISILKSLEIELRETFADRYLYEFAESGMEALEILADLGQEGIQTLLVVSDWLMPGMKGDELLTQIHQDHPDIITVMLTGQADEQAVQRACEQAQLYSCIYKPWQADELRQIIHTALE